MGEIVEDSATREQQVSAPASLSPDHDASQFDCGKEPLNDWIKSRAARSEGRSARCYVVATDTRAIVGYYCLSTGAVAHDNAPRTLKRNLPNPTPVMIVGRLAVDRQYGNRGIGSGMLKDGLNRILQASKIVGAKAAIVHAIDDDAISFYTHFGFQSFPTEIRTMYLSIETIAKSI